MKNFSYNVENLMNVKKNSFSKKFKKALNEMKLRK
jgi:hypothetical protein